jgi:hypothetical protein
MTPPKRLRRSPQGATPVDRQSRIHGVHLAAVAAIHDHGAESAVALP